MNHPRRCGIDGATRFKEDLTWAATAAELVDGHGGGLGYLGDTPRPVRPVRPLRTHYSVQYLLDHGLRLSSSVTRIIDDIFVLYLHNSAETTAVSCCYLQGDREDLARGFRLNHLFPRLEPEHGAFEGT